MESDEDLLKDLCNLEIIIPTFYSVRYPQTNGSLERFYYTLLEIIRKHMTEHPEGHPLNILPYALI